MGLFDKLFGKKDIVKNNQMSYQIAVPTEKLMTSHYKCYKCNEDYVD